MKKILGLMAIVSVFILVACGGDDEGGGVTCRQEFREQDLLFTIQSEEGEVTSIDLEARSDISNLDEEDIAQRLADLEADEANFTRDGYTLIINETVDPAELLGTTDLELEVFLERMESMLGVTCDF